MHLLLLVVMFLYDPAALSLNSLSDLGIVEYPRMSSASLAYLKSKFFLCAMQQSTWYARALKCHKRYVDSYGWADDDNAVMKGDCREVVDKGTPLKRPR
jgi:hypothetical protein